VILQGDARHIPLRDESVQCVVTSPPFWGLRDYGVNGQLGLEETPEEYVANLVAVFREVRRVLRDDGTVWLNLGDSYSAVRSYQVRDNKHVEVGNNMASTIPPGLKPKDMVGIPWRTAFALQADRWYLRSDIIWAKPNPMPESVTDRPTKSHEYLFLLAKAANYFYDAHAVSELTVQVRGGRVHNRIRDVGGRTDGFTRGAGGAGFNLGSAMRNRRSVWTIPTEPYSGSHFATFPRKLIEPCILAGTSARGCCAACGTPWERVIQRDILPPPDRIHNNPFKHDAMTTHGEGRATLRNLVENRTLDWRPTCTCGASTHPCTVLDPFVGSGTTVAVAESIGRRGIGIDLKIEYLSLANNRLRSVTLGLPL